MLNANIKEMTVELWWLHIKAEEKTVAFMLFSVVMQFIYSLGKTGTATTEKKQENLGVGERGGEGQSRGTGGPNSRSEAIKSRALLYPSLKYLQAQSYVPGSNHPVIRETL